MYLHVKLNAFLFINSFEVYMGILNGQVVSFISQSGDQGKSVLAQAFAVYANVSGLNTSLVCLDREHRSSCDWADDRVEYGIDPIVNVVRAVSVKDAVKQYGAEELYILDTPSRASSSLYEIEKISDVIVLPTTPDEKNLRLTLTVVDKLLNAGADINKIIICINRLVFTTKASAVKTRVETLNYLHNYDFNGQKVNVCNQFIPEYISYKNALKQRLTMLETAHPKLNQYTTNLLDAIIEVLNNVQ